MDASAKPSEANTPGSRHDFWDRVERLARIASVIALPVVLAVLAAVLHSRESLTHDYIDLAMSILKEPAKSDMTLALREWAVDVLNRDAPIKFSDELVAKLKSGKAVLPTAQPSLHNEAARIQLAQEFLKALGLYHGAEDGMYTKDFYEALKSFQAEHHLDVDGYPGVQSLRTLQQACNESATSKPGVHCPTKELPKIW